MDSRQIDLLKTVLSNFEKQIVSLKDIVEKQQKDIEVLKKIAKIRTQSH